MAHSNEETVDGYIDSLSPLLNEDEKINSKPNIGKSCIKFKKIAYIPIEYIGYIVSDMTINDFINQYEKTRNGG